MNLKIGSIIRIYYNEDTFDEGYVSCMSDTYIDVDFYDWIERWPTSDRGLFILHTCWYSPNLENWSPTRRGETITDFNLTNQAKMSIW